MENLENTRGGIDFLEVANISKVIRDLAQEAADLSKKLSEEDISEEEKDALSSRLTEVVERGSKLSEERAKIFAEY